MTRVTNTTILLTSTWRFHWRFSGNWQEHIRERNIRCFGSPGHLSLGNDRLNVTITEINPEAFKWGVDRYDRLLCPGLQPGPPSQTLGGLGQRYWCVSEVTWPPQMELRRWRSSGPSSVMSMLNLHCAAVGCTVDSRKLKSLEKYPWMAGVAFIKFPTSPFHRRIWYNILRRGGPNDRMTIENIGKWQRVCSQHFVDARPTPQHPHPTLFDYNKFKVSKMDK